MTLHPARHRKQVRHYDEPGHCHELTFSCYDRLPLLTNDLWRGLLSKAIEKANDNHDYHLVAFVYMPEHIHLLLYPGQRASKIDSLLKAIKRPYSFRVKRLLEESKSRLLRRLTIRQRPGIETFRFWQEGPGYDRNLDRPGTVVAAIDYIHRNPERRGLVKFAIDWQWSSARWYAGLPYESHIRLPELEKLPAEFLVDAAR